MKKTLQDYSKREILKINFLNPNWAIALTKDTENSYVTSITKSDATFQGNMEVKDILTVSPPSELENNFDYYVTISENGEYVIIYRKEGNEFKATDYYDLDCQKIHRIPPDFIGSVRSDFKKRPFVKIKEIPKGGK